MATKHAEKNAQRAAIAVLAAFAFFCGSMSVAPVEARPKQSLKRKKETAPPAPAAKNMGAKENAKQAKKKQKKQKKQEKEQKKDSAEPKKEEPAAAPNQPSPTGTKPPWPQTAPLAPFGPPLPKEWSLQEIKDASAACATLMRDLPINFQSLAPIREGVCGAPAPIKLTGFAYEPPLELRPAAAMTCKLAVLLHQWLSNVVQPKAKELLHASIVRLGNLAAYDCRPRYGDNSQRMSNHAYAKAIDISGFITAKGEVISVLEHWSLEDERSRFLKEAHAGACKIFGTVLGPDANEAHKNHFHLDAEDRRRSLCDFYDRSKITARKAPEKPAAPNPQNTAVAPAADAKNRKK